jgi:heme-degrading monooxygenase HmoA
LEPIVGGVVVAALIRIPTGMNTDGYDAVNREAAASLGAATGFRFHVAYPTDEGVVVLEVWDSPEQHMQWFDQYVRPHLPPGTELQHEVTPLHNVLQP